MEFLEVSEKILFQNILNNFLLYFIEFFRDFSKKWGRKFMEMFWNTIFPKKSKKCHGNVLEYNFPSNSNDIVGNTICSEKLSKFPEYNFSGKWTKSIDIFWNTISQGKLAIVRKFQKIPFFHKTGKKIHGNVLEYNYPGNSQKNVMETYWNTIFRVNPMKL